MSKTATLDLQKDGTAWVVIGGKAATLDSIITATLQDDRELAAEYIAIMRQIAGRMYLSISLDYDGDARDGVSMYVVSFLAPDVNGQRVSKNYRFTPREFRGIHGAVDAKKEDEARLAILRRAVALGYGDCQCSTRRGIETVARAIGELAA